MFSLSARSERKLEGVHPDLVRVVRNAIRLTPVDFTVIEGLRTKERQAQLVASGASQTHHSRHLTGHAVDLAALVGGKLDWSMSVYYQIAEAMRQAAYIERVPIRWGGAWARIDNSYVPVWQLQDNYIKWRRAEGNKPFLDGPHFELPRDLYP